MIKLAIAIFLSLFTTLAQAELQVQVEPDQVNMGEAFQLILTHTGFQKSGLPDLTVLQKDFIILGTERSVSMSIINGNTQSANQWIITLRAKKPGILPIPSIKIGMELSKPSTIDVQAGNRIQKKNMDLSKNQIVLMEATVDEKKPYLNQQIIYTVKIYFSKQVINVNYQGPQIENALQVPLGEPKDYQTIINNTNYLVRELKYAVFPQKSGSLTIISPALSGITYELDPQKVHAQAKAINLIIQPIPKPFDGKTWLPAKEVQLTEEYENSAQNINQGSTLTRTIDIEAIGLASELIPALEFKDSEDFKVYPEKGNQANPLKQGEIAGTKEIKITYLFNKVGKVVIPELRLPWVNTKTGKEEVAVLPPRSIEVVPSAINTKSHPIVKSNTEQPVSVATLSAKDTNIWPWLVAAFFALAWLATIILWRWQNRSRSLGKGSYKTALNELEHACTEGNSLAARDALLKWGTLHWPDAQVLNLNDIKKLAKDAQLRKQIDLLTQSLYKDEKNSAWYGGELFMAVSSIKKGKDKKKRKAIVLPPINPP